MSLPSTPARSNLASPFSSPSTTQDGTSPRELTPRSKVKAMLAAIGDDDDGESANTALPTQPQQQSRMPPKAAAGNIQKVNTREDLEPENALLYEEKYDGDQSDQEEEVEDDEDSLFVPHGRLAAQLRKKESAKQKSSSSGEENATNNAYARIRKKLLSRQEKNERDKSIASKEHLSSQGGTPATRSVSRSKSPATISERLGSSSLDRARSQELSPGLISTPQFGTKLQKPVEMPIGSDVQSSESPADPGSNNRFAGLLARKKTEMEERQAADDKKLCSKYEKMLAFEKELERDASSDASLLEEDRLAESRMTQLSRPTRKASKKALEEMNRETQRMSRNMQLAHQAKTKKKITKDSLFARFNFRISANPTTQPPVNPSSSTAASSAPASDLEETLGKQSPPTSPIGPDNSFVSSSLQGIDKDSVEVGVERGSFEDEDDLPSMLDVMIQPDAHLDKGKREISAPKTGKSKADSVSTRGSVFTQLPIKVRPPKPTMLNNEIDLDSDSDSEVLAVRKHRSARNVFDRLPASKVQEGRSMRTLRVLAHLNSPTKEVHGKKATMSLTDMQASLQKRARQQAVEERVARLEDLRRRGIIVQTAEERQQDQAEVEDLLEKARREGEEIMQKEKRAAKKAKIENGELDDLSDSSDEDEDYHEDQGDEPDVELSGSDDEEEIDESISEEEETLDNDGEGGVSLGKDDPQEDKLVDDQASEDGDDEQEEDSEGDDGSEKGNNPPKKQIQRPRRIRMVIDDEDEEVLGQENGGTIQDDRTAVAVPHIPVSPSDLGVVPMGMTQAFAATMADTQTEVYDKGEEQDSLAQLDTVPEPDFPMYAEDSLLLVEDSQNGLQQPETNTSKEIDLHLSQSQIQYDILGDTQTQAAATQMSEIPDPTQDVGFVLCSPAPLRIISEPPSTVDTVLLPSATGNASPVQKRRRLHRRAIIEEEDLSYVDGEPAMSDREKADPDIATNAFDAMKKARKAAEVKAAQDAFDKKNSEAKGMVEEQAQESEDEYAGLGGVSDEDSGEEDEDVNAMMDHGDVDVDERRLAQLFA